MVIFALGLVALMAAAALALDVSNGFVHKEKMQSAADASALAQAGNLGDAPTTAEIYACLNPFPTLDKAQCAANRPVELHVCSPAPVGGKTSDSDCYAKPYNGNSSKVYVKVGETVDTFFASVIGHGNFDVSASAAASSTGGTGSFVFAGDTACDAIKISNGQDDFTQGAVWSNGGITTSGKPNTAETVWVAVPSCNTKIGAPFVTTSGATITPTTVPQRTLTNASDWPYPLPTPPTSSSCTTGSVTINPAWVTTHPTHGVYCYTGTITLGMPSGTTVSGYEFVSLGTAGNTIKTGTAGGKYVGYGEDKLLFYAPNGGLAFTQGITVEGIILAPKGTVTMTGAGTTQTGFIEALNVVLTNSNTTFIGTGPGPSGGDVSLDE